MRPPLAALKTIGLLEGILRQIQQMFEGFEPSVDNLISPILMRSMQSSPTGGIAPLILSSGNLMNLTLATTTTGNVSGSEKEEEESDNSKGAQKMPEFLVSSPTGNQKGPNVWGKLDISTEVASCFMKCLLL